MPPPLKFRPWGDGMEMCILLSLILMYSGYTISALRFPPTRLPYSGVARHKLGTEVASNDVKPTTRLDPCSFVTPLIIFGDHVPKANIRANSMKVKVKVIKKNGRQPTSWQWYASHGNLLLTLCSPWQKGVLNEHWTTITQTKILVVRFTACCNGSPVIVYTNTLTRN